MHDFPDAQETEPKDHLGPASGPVEAAWWVLVNSEAVPAAAANELDFTLTVRVPLESGCEYLQYFNMTFHPKSDEGDENYMMKPILFGKHKQSRRKFPSSYVILGPCHPKHIIYLNMLPFPPLTT